MSSTSSVASFSVLLPHCSLIGSSGFVGRFFGMCGVSRFYLFTLRFWLCRLFYSFLVLKGGMFCGVPRRLAFLCCGLGFSFRRSRGASAAACRGLKGLALSCVGDLMGVKWLRCSPAGWGERSSPACFEEVEQDFVQRLKG